MRAALAIGLAFGLAGLGVGSAGAQAPVYSVFLLISPTNNPDGHLQAMEKIFLNLQDDSFRKFLRQSDTRHGPVTPTCPQTSREIARRCEALRGVFAGQGRYSRPAQAVSRLVV